MKASEAKKMAESYTTEDYSQIMKEIQEAAEKGKFFIWWYKPINIGLRADLTKDGYTVGDQMFDRNEYLTKISW